MMNLYKNNYIFLLVINFYHQDSYIEDPQKKDSYIEKIHHYDCNDYEKLIVKYFLIVSMVLENQ